MEAGVLQNCLHDWIKIRVQSLAHVQDSIIKILYKNANSKLEKRNKNQGGGGGAERLARAVIAWRTYKRHFGLEIQRGAVQLHAAEVFVGKRVGTKRGEQEG